MERNRMRSGGAEWDRAVGLWQWSEGATGGGGLKQTSHVKMSIIISPEFVFQPGVVATAAAGSRPTPSGLWLCFQLPFFFF